MDAAPPPAPPPHRLRAGVRALALVLALLAGARRASGGEDDLAGRWEALGRTSIGQLHELARWCNGKRLFAARAEVYGLILAFDPDDQEARKRLRYRRSRDGRWTRRPRSSSPRNLGTGKKRYVADLAAWRATFLEAIHPLVQGAIEASDDRLRCRILRAAIPAAPDDPALREAHGEVEHTWNGSTTWWLAESEVASERRHVLERIGAAVVLEVPEPRYEEPRAAERCERVDWGQALVGRHVRVVGTCSPPEMDQHYANAEALAPVLAAVLGLDEAELLPEPDVGPATLYVTLSAEVGNRFLDAYAGSRADALDDLRPRPVLRIPGRRAVLVKDPSRTWRLEAGAKELVALALERHLGLGDDDAWLSAGLTHYVTRLVTRTREVFRTADRTTDGVTAWLGAPDASVHLLRTQDWLGACHDVLTKDPLPSLAETADKDLRHLRPDDVLLGYGLAAWLVEGHPEHATAFLRAVGRTEPEALEAAALAYLGCDLPELRARLTRWLAETLGRLDRRPR